MAFVANVNINHNVHQHIRHKHWHFGSNYLIFLLSIYSLFTLIIAMFFTDNSQPVNLNLQEHYVTYLMSTPMSLNAYTVM